jgi:ribokinase
MTSVGTTPEQPTICVVGSVNVDLIVTGPHLPTPGETVTGGVFSRGSGGKGANQALAARHHGAEVALIAAVGDDPMATEALTLLRREGIDLSGVTTVANQATGVALIAVDGAGENQIAVAPGANRLLEPTHVRAGGFDAVLCQLEIPDRTLIEVAEQVTGLLCINAGPARPLPEPLLQRSDVIIVNETEHDALEDQLADFAGLLVVTRGSRGADGYRAGIRVATAKPPVVDAIDTVGAGDAFCGTLVVELARGADVNNALARGCEAGALATTRSGAQARADGT